jgi:AAA domain
MTRARGPSPAPLIVIIRGPIGAGKTTLMRGLARRAPYRFWALDTDALNGGHPQDDHGEHLDTEWPLEIEIVALHARIVLGRGLNLVLDPGLLLTKREVDRFLRLVGRTRRDPRVILYRLTVTPEEAIRRKATVKPAFIRAAHRGWQPTPVTGEIVIDTNGLTPKQVLREALRELVARTAPLDSARSRARQFGRKT